MQNVPDEDESIYLMMEVLLLFPGPSDVDKDRIARKQAAVNDKTSPPCPIRTRRTSR